jgi:hypothetical protein
LFKEVFLKTKLGNPSNPSYVGGTGRGIAVTVVEHLALSSNPRSKGMEGGKHRVVSI